ncbi:hypothetical protein ACLKA6_011309 [Drosophila palustris]
MGKAGAHYLALASKFDVVVAAIAVEDLDELDSTSVATKKASVSATGIRNVSQAITIGLSSSWSSQGCRQSSVCLDSDSDLNIAAAAEV